MNSSFSSFAARLKPSAIRSLTKVAYGRPVISFAGGLPNPDMFPDAELAALAQEVITQRKMETLQYGLTQGFGPFIEQVITYLAGRGIHGLKNENLLIAAGSQQSLDLAGRIFIDPGDAVAIESPGYVGAISAFEHLGARLVGIPVLEDGPDLDRLESVLRREKPKFFYTTPNFANPSGALMSLKKRKELLELASRHDLWIMEDDAYGELFFSECSLQEVIPLKALDTDGRVIYLQTFSKTIAPGLRLGAIAAPAQVVSLIEMTKQAADMFTGGLTQVLACEFLKRGIFTARLPALRKTYEARRDAMHEALGRHLPGARWTRPKGGFFLWLDLPGLDAQERLAPAIEAGVVYVPGAPFCTAGEADGRSMARLSYSREPEDRIRRGVELMAGVVAGITICGNL